jgi:hypothetical protein
MFRILSITLLITVSAVISGVSRAVAAELHPETLTAWSNYVKATESRISNELSSKEGFLSLDFQAASKAARDRQTLRSGNILIEKVHAANGSSKDIPDGMVHHWRGVVFIPGTTLDSVLIRVENPTAENVKQEDVMDSRVLEKEPGQLRLFLKLQRSKIVTVIYNTEHLIRYLKSSDSKAWSSSVSTKIAELDKGREKPQGHDSGFLWKLNSYWRYEQIDGGVIVECESMTLSRSIPPVLSWIVNPIIESVARESMQRTLQSFRTRITKIIQQTAGSHVGAGFSPDTQARMRCREEKATGV